MKIPKKYLTTNPNIMKREIEKHSDKSDKDTSAYGPWDADYDSGKAGKGKKVSTKTSKYTKKYKEMFEDGESHSQKNISSYDDFDAMAEELAKEVFDSLSEEELTEGSATGSVDNPDSPAYKALKKKSEKSGFPLGILKQVFKRGKSAWARGHIPGTVPNQWALARVNSFIVGGKTTKMQDKKLYQKAKNSIK